MKNFEQQYQQIFNIDPLYEAYLQAWIAYHKAADTIDGHLPPGHSNQVRLGRLAVTEGTKAMHKIIPYANLSGFNMGDDWHRAKLEALRLVESGQLYDY